jgi:hypothetical protein
MGGYGAGVVGDVAGMLPVCRHFGVRGMALVGRSVWRKMPPSEFVYHSQML